METINILHLSDLHIGEMEDSNHRMIQESLIEDIKKQLNDKAICISAIVMTGDIINKAQDSAYGVANTLFEQLMHDLSVKREQIVIVPGNHDIPRTDIDQMLAERVRENQGLLREVGVPDGWKRMQSRFDHFKEFANNVSGAVDLQAYGIGVREVKVEGRIIHFYLLNTAWLSCGNNDYKRLAVGRWQLEYIKKQKKKLGQPDLTVTLSHHPFQWFNDEQEELTKDILLNPKKLGTDILMHGHVHDAKLRVITEPDYSVAELTSGIGYPEESSRIHGQNKVENCRYSIYKIEPQEGSIECICRKSTNKGNFVADTSLYSSGEESGVYYLQWKKSVVKQVAEESALTIESGRNLELDPVPVVSGWCGRRFELNQLSDLSYKAVLISGVGGQGKTALAAEYMYRNKRENKVFDESLWVDCRELQDTFQLKIQQLLQVMSGGEETVILYRDELSIDTINRFIAHIRKRKYLVVLDNVDAYVNMESEEFVGELKMLVDKVLEVEHQSKIVLTCRIPVFDSSANFVNIKLDGLKEPDGIEFFKARNIDITKDEEIALCKKVISHTKGHPWWLGLIAGQIVTEYQNFEQYMRTQGNNFETGNSRLKSFFDNIWNHLGENAKGEIGQKILRLLVESIKPLNTDEIARSIGENFSKTNQVLMRIKKLGLLEPHQETEEMEMLYQVHPLLREYLHDKFSVEKQQPFVQKLLALFLDSKLIFALFNRGEDIPTNFAKYQSSEDIVCSIDTCLNSRNIEQALELLSQFYSRLRDEGLHKDYIALGCRIFKEINWEKEQVVSVKRKARLLCDLIDQLNSMGDYGNQTLFLNHYETMAEVDTVAYSGYLSIKSFICWREEEYGKALALIEKFENMQIKNSDLWDFGSIKNLKGLTLRDVGQLKEALDIFEAEEESASQLGNIARCFQKMKRYEEAVEKLEESITLLKKGSVLVDRMNEGYAYLWLSEIYSSMDDKKNEDKYYALFRKQWEEYAPGLLRCYDNSKEKECGNG